MADRFLIREFLLLVLLFEIRVDLNGLKLAFVSPMQEIRELKGLAVR